MNPKTLWPMSIIISTFLTGVIVWFQIASPFRSWIVFWFLMVCPGMACIRFFHVKGWILEITLGIALSLAIDTLISEGMALIGWWSASGALIVLASISLLGAFGQLTLARPTAFERNLS